MAERPGGKNSISKQEIELNNTLEEAFDICLSDEKVENLNEGTTVGTFTVNEMAPEGNYVSLFAQEKATLIIHILR